MKKIPLSQGKFTIVDDADYDWLMKIKWSATKSAHNWYVVNGKTGKRRYMHREIMKPTNGQVVHHKNGDSLDNRRANLEVCTQTENLKQRVFGAKNN